MKLPIKARILEYALEKNDTFTAKEVAESLKKEYKGERTTSLKSIQGIIDTYCGVGIMKAAEIQMAADGVGLAISYEVTGYGKTCKKMIPKTNTK